MSKFCIHGDYGQACAQCHYEFHGGKCPCDSCKLIRSGRRIATLEQQRDELLAALEDIARGDIYPIQIAIAAIAKVKT